LPEPYAEVRNAAGVVTEHDTPGTGDQISGSRFDDMPVIMLTSRKEEEGEAPGFGTDAADLMAEPAGTLKLQAGIQKTAVCIPGFVRQCGREMGHE